jgi:hypothetical protein
MKRGTIKLLVTVLLVIGISGVSNAQKVFTFRYNQEELNEPESEAIRKHFLGEDIAYKMQLFKESYTYIEPASATSPADKIIVEKQPIFFSIKKMEKYLKKSVRKGYITEEEAVKILDTALNVALNIRYQDTKEFEDLLYSIKEEEEIVALYTNRVKLDI